MIEAFHAVVTYGAMRGSRRSKNLAGEAVLQFDADVFHHDFFGTWGWAVGGPVSPVGPVLALHLAFNILCFGLGGSRDDAGVTEGRPEQVGQDK